MWECLASDWDQVTVTSYLKRGQIWKKNMRQEDARSLAWKSMLV